MKPKSKHPSKKTETTDDKSDMREIYRELTKGNPDAIVGWGDEPMTYLGEGVYLQADGSLYTDE